MTAAVTLPGCLVTQPVHFDQPANSPPAIYDAPGTSYPLNQFIRPAAVATDGGTHAPTGVTVRVTVYDADVSQQDQWLAYVDSNEIAPCAGCGGFIPPSGDVRRQLELTIPLTLDAMHASCHRIDLYVSGAFRPASHDAVDPLDLARVTWWVTWEPASTTVDVSLCPQ